MVDAARNASIVVASKLTIFRRLTRAQFLPLIILPALSGTFLAYRYDHVFSVVNFVLMLLGVIFLHLGANTIDDCYDFQNGVDEIANSRFPKDFGGWKPIPRGLISLREARLVSYALFVGSLLLGVYLAFVVGLWSLILGIAGIILAVAYTAPPLKLDYRGMGLGELSIFFAFGPIPVLGSFYVQTGTLSIPALLVSVPVGMMTVTVLIDHDLIFYEVYLAAKKMSLGAMLGRRKSLEVSLLLTLFSYALISTLIATGILPIWSVLAPLASSLILARKAKTFVTPNEPPSYYVPFTENGMLSNWVFSFVLALSMLI